jgi:hypothetical protein
MPTTGSDSPVVPFTFSIVGVQKAGTTTLARLLTSHEAIARPPKKELHFFDDETRVWDPPSYDGYYAARTSPAELMAGDATPRYLFHPQALQRMHDYNPDMRLIAVFRDPIERLFSHWAMLRVRRTGFPDWPRFITRFRPERLPERVPAARHRKFLSKHGVARGYYGQQLDRGLAIFDRSSWLLLEFRELLRDHGSALDRITDHLGIARFAEHPPLRHGQKGPEVVHGTAPTAVDLAALAELYRDDLVRFSELSGIDVSAWPTRRILDGELEPSTLAASMASKVIAVDR